MSFSDGDICSQIRGYIDIGQFESALRLIERTVETVIDEPLNTAEIFGNAYLDRVCQEIGANRLPITLGQKQVSSVDVTGDFERPIVFIASRLQSSGGHTAVLADIARRANSEVVVLLTGVGGWTSLAAIGHLFADIPRLKFMMAPRGSRLCKLDWLILELSRLRPSQVWLFNHHQDSVAIAAVQPNQGYELNYLHHGDHHLCLGVYLQFGEHFDPHPMGFQNCRHILGLAGNKYLPLVASDPSLPVRTSDVLRGPITTSTAAGKNKLEHAYYPNYAEVIPALLAETGGRHIHFGRLSWAYRRRIARAMLRAGVSSDAFKYVPYVRSVACSLREEGVDLYITSFPYAGARTLVEVMSAGIPSVTHCHISKPFLAAVDMLPPGSQVWANTQDLLLLLKNLDRSSLAHLGLIARSHYEAFHTPARLLEALAGEVAAQTIPVSGFSYSPDMLALALHRARQFTTINFLRRRFRHLMRYCRGFFL